MLSSSYLHVPGVGPVTERRIWESGLLTWDQFLSAPTPNALSPRMAARITDAVTLSRDHLRQDDHRFFATRLPSREHWRAFPEFSHRIAYLDIETTGMEGHDCVTMVGLYDGRDVRTYTRGEDFDEFFEDIGRFGLLVTFFGSGFDLPFLRRRYPGLVLDQIHIDLCHVLRRLGLKGGLKHIERQLDIPRTPETEFLDGWDAVRLWREWERGSQEALDLLKAYNKEDVRNLEILLRYAYPRLRAKAGLPPPA
jgi:uncharacterized protein YprB with RNaseH-like and TPR domain